MSEFDQSRRDVLVTMMGVTLGTFMMPGGTPITAAETAATGAGEAAAGATVTKSLEILGRGAVGRLKDGSPCFVYTRSDGETMIWWAADEEEFAEMRRFYYATRNPGCPSVDESEVFPIQRSAEERRLIAEVVANPDDDAPRLRYGDWLEKHGDPRGEFIRVDVMSDRLSESDKEHQQYLDRYWEMLEQYGKDWYQPFAAFGLWPTMGAEFSPHYWMRRGLIDYVEISAQAILAKPELLFQAAPAVTRLGFEVDELNLEALCARPEMQQIRSLEFVDGFDPRFETDGTSSPGTFTNATMKTLVNCKSLSSLEVLDISGGDVDDEGFRMLAEAPMFGGLKNLNLAHCNLTGATFDLLHNLPEPSRLEILEVGSNHLDAAAALVLLTASKIPKLQELSLRENEFGPGALAPLSASPPKELRTLNLSDCALNDSDGRALLDWLDDSRVEDLNLSFNNLTTEGVAALWKSRGMKDLQHIDLCGCRIGDEGAKGLATMKRRPETLMLADCGITATGVEAIASAPQFARLTMLDLRKNAIGSAGAKALAESRYLKQLTGLAVGKETVGERGRQLLLDRFGEDIVTFGEDVDD